MPCRVRPCHAHPPRALHRDRGLRSRVRGRVAFEAATRDAAEAAANQYVATPPGPLESPAPGGNTPYYSELPTFAAGVVCAEMRDLPSTNYDPGHPPTCPDMPVVMVCVHDGQDNGCASQASAGGGGIPSNCSGFTPPPNRSQTTNQDGTQSRWVGDQGKGSLKRATWVR